METQPKFWKALYAAWIFFDGRKTVIGGTLVGLSAYLQGLTAIIHATGDPWQLAINLLAYTGTWITTGGAVHKIAKNRTNDSYTVGVWSPDRPVANNEDFIPGEIKSDG